LLQNFALTQLFDLLMQQLELRLTLIG
jgi:hypothetical protein